MLIRDNIRLLRAIPIVEPAAGYKSIDMSSIAIL
jgi:hypothetical protein